jgi:hypothetical protein
MFDSLYLDTLISEDYVVKLKEEIEKDKEKDDNDDWLCVEAPQLDDYLDMYSKGEVSSTYDFRIISNAFKKFLQSPKSAKNENLLQGTDYQAIDPNDQEAKLIDLNVDSIQASLKDIFKSKPKSKHLNHDENENDQDENNDDDENDSFYEIEDDLLDNDEEQEHDGLTKDEMSDNFRNYMDLMDSELKGEKNLGRVVDLTNSSGKEDLEIDLNLVTNALESYSSQLGLTGPVSNILKSIGL